MMVEGENHKNDRNYRRNPANIEGDGQFKSSFANKALKLRKEKQAIREISSDDSAE